MNLLLFDTDYLMKSLYVIGNYTMLKGIVKMDFPEVYFTKYDSIYHKADYIIVNLKNHRKFVLENINRNCRSIVYTLTPLEAFVLSRRLNIKDRTIIIHVRNIFIVIYLNNMDICNMLKTTVLYEKKTITLKELIELMMNRHIEKHIGPIEEEDIEILENKIEAKNLYCFKRLNMGFLRGIEFYKLETNVQSSSKDKNKKHHVKNRLKKELNITEENIKRKKVHLNIFEFLGDSPNFNIAYG